VEPSWHVYVTRFKQPQADSKYLLVVALCALVAVVSMVHANKVFHTIWYDIKGAAFPLPCQGAVRGAPQGLAV